jgi:hypothetical protein
VLRDEDSFHALRSNIFHQTLLSQTLGYIVSEH